MRHNGDSEEESRDRARFSRIQSVHLGLVAVLLAAAFLQAAWSSSSIFERLPRTEDEVTFLFQAQTIAEGQLIAPAPEHPEFFAMSFVIARDGQWFGKYPPGFPAVLSLGVLAGHPWLVNAVAATVAVGLVIGLGRRFYDLRSGLIAGALMVMSPFFILQSGSLLSHVVALCWTLTMLFLFDVSRRRDAPWAAIGVGCAAGALLLTRPLTAVGLILPLTIIAAIDLTRQRPFRRRYALMVAAVLPFTAALLVYNDMTTGSPFRSAYELWWTFDRIGFGADRGIEGHWPSDALVNARSNMIELSIMLFGWPWRLSLAPALIPVGIALWRWWRGGLTSTTSADLLIVGMVVGLIAVHMLYWTPGRMYGPRYYFEAIGALSLLSARGLVWAWDVAGRRSVRFEGLGRFSRFAVPAVLALLLGYNVLVSIPAQADRFRGWNGVTAEDLNTVERAGLKNAIVFVPRPDWPAYAPFFVANSTTLDGDIIYAIDWGDARNPILMRDFPGRPPYRYVDGRLIPLSLSNQVGDAHR